MYRHSRDILYYCTNVEDIPLLSEKTKGRDIPSNDLDMIVTTTKYNVDVGLAYFRYRYRKRVRF